MRSMSCINFCISLFITTFSISVLAQETPATIPDSFIGTYNLTYGDFSNGLADDFFSDGEDVTIVIKTGGILCVNGEQLSDPVLRNGNPAEAFWDGSNGLGYALSNLSNEAFNEVNLAVDGSFAGQFQGSKTSSETTCASGSGTGSGSGTPSLSASQQDMLNLAEQLFASIFKNGGPVRVAQGYTYRLYGGSGAAIGFKDGQVFTIGGPFGNKLKSLGPLSQVTVSLQNYQAKIELNAGDIDTGNSDVDITGDFDLTIDGTIATVVGGFATPPVDFSVVINDIVAPDPTDTDEVTSIITETLDNVEGVQDLEVIVTNNTASRITFTVSFSAIQNGVTVNMELEYDYVR